MRIRLSPKLHRQLQESAEREYRSMNEEIVRRLERSFQTYRLTP